MTETPDLPDLCWPIDTACLGEDWENIPASTRSRAVAMATSTLYRLTLGRMGGCSIQVRPCPQRRSYEELSAFWTSSWMRPYLTETGWVNCLCDGPCGCTAGCKIELGGYVGRVDEVKVGSNIIPTSDYKIVDNNSIVYQGSDPCPFPKTQNMDLPLGADGTFSVTYLPAREVDGLGAWAAGVLAVEFAKACGGGRCRLPANVTAVTRQGVSMTLVTGAFPDGRTGIREVDAFIALYNPNGIAKPSAVWSPDMPSARVQS